MNQLLPPRLGALLALEQDIVFSNRLRRVLEAAARAISKLGELDLIKYEDELPLDGTADLSLWEQVAPVVGSTIADVNAMVAEVDRDFSLAELIDDEKQRRAVQEVLKLAAELKVQVAHFGQRVRDPSVVGDRWNLIAELQSFRGRFRSRIGNMVFDVASALGDVKRRDVEPGYEEALGATLVVRSTTADLRRLMHSRVHKVAEAAPEDVEWHISQIEKELNAFGRTAAWRSLRAPDKKVILEFRAALAGLAALKPTKVDLLRLLEPFVEFVDTFANVSQREILVDHDQEAQAAVGVILERAVSAVDHHERLAAFSEALSYGQALYGRSPDFDAFLRKVRKTPPGPPTLAQEVENFLALLAGLSSPA